MTYTAPGAIWGHFNERRVGEELTSEYKITLENYVDATVIEVARL
jgi:hypothetical protein